MCKSFKHTLIQRRYTNSQHTYEKIITTLDLQANVQHTKETSSYAPLDSTIKKKKKENNQCGKAGGKLEPLCSGIEKWCNHSGKQFDGSLKCSTYNYHITQ